MKYFLYTFLFFQNIICVKVINTGRKKDLSKQIILSLEEYSSLKEYYAIFIRNFHKDFFKMFEFKLKNSNAMVDSNIFSEIKSELSSEYFNIVLDHICMIHKPGYRFSDSIKDYNNTNAKKDFLEYANQYLQNRMPYVVLILKDSTNSDIQRKQWQQDN
ncbi:hypothetical protein EDEG_01264, partial [Edhazardia aedis USNM 41457]